MKYITETYNLIMDSKINPLSKIPNLQVRHLVMQLLAYMWSLILLSDENTLAFPSTNFLLHSFF